MAKTSPIGTIDKSGRFLKTATGWEPIRKKVPAHVEPPSAPAALTPQVGEKPKYSSIPEAQIAWLKGEINHTGFLQEQAAMYRTGIISKQHSNIKLK